MRKYNAYGKQNDYFDDCNIIGWTREGDYEHEDSGLAVIMTDNCGGSKRMYIGKQFSGKIFYDCIGGIREEVLIDSEGYGYFHVDGGNVSVWIKKHKKV